MFDEQPDGDPHGECALEIKRLEAINTELLTALQAMLAEFTTRQSLELDIWSDAQYAARAAIEKATGATA